MFDPMKQDTMREAAGVEQPQQKSQPSVSWDNAPKGGNGSFGTPPPTAVGSFGMGPYNPNGKPGSTSGGVPPSNVYPPKGPATMPGPPGGQGQMGIGWQGGMNNAMPRPGGAMPGPPQSYGPTEFMGPAKGPAIMPGPPQNGAPEQWPSKWKGMEQPQGQHWGQLSPDGASTQPGWFQNQTPEQTMGAQQGVPPGMDGMEFMNRLRRMRGMGAPPRPDVTPFVNRPQDTTGPVEGPPPTGTNYGDSGIEGFRRPETGMPPPMPYDLFQGAPQPNAGPMNPALQSYMQSF